MASNTTEGTILAVVGPTGVGKSNLALHLASELDGEIISADSRQVYRYMDIGTSKPSIEQQSDVKHHLIDVVDPDEEYNLVMFLNQAYSAIQEIQSRSKLPILVGGTGQYIWALLEGWKVPKIPPNPTLRRALELKATSKGPEFLYKELSSLNPSAAVRIDRNNIRRLIRALEIHNSSAGLITKTTRESPNFNQLVLGLTLERGDLYNQIDLRVKSMIESGWVKEVDTLHNMGFGINLPSLSSLGYKEISQHLHGKYRLEEAITKIQFRTHKFARKQYSWFRLQDRRICWFNGKSDQIEKITNYVCETIKTT